MSDETQTPAVDPEVARLQADLADARDACTALGGQYAEERELRRRAEDSLRMDSAASAHRREEDREAIDALRAEVESLRAELEAARPTPCTQCGGTGVVDITYPTEDGEAYDDCPRCKGHDGCGTGREDTAPMRALVDRLEDTIANAQANDYQIRADLESARAATAYARGWEDGRDVTVEWLRTNLPALDHDGEYLLDNADLAEMANDIRALTPPTTPPKEAPDA